MTSEAQREAALARRPQRLEQIRPGIWAFGQPLTAPSELSTLTYLLEDDRGGIHVLDPGMPSDENWLRLVDTLAAVGFGVDAVASVIVTHLHPDHLGLAGRLREASGAPVVLHRAEQAALDAGSTPRWADGRLRRDWGVPEGAVSELEASLARIRVEFTADLLVDDGAALDIPGRSLRVLHTPAHTPGSVCLHGDGLLFTGDTVLPDQVAGVGLGGDTASNPFRDLRESMRRLSAFDDAEVLPGHGWRFVGIAQRAAEIEAHHGRRTAEVATVLEREPEASVWRIASQLTWSGGWEHLTGWRLGSALQQTEQHAALVREG